MSQTPEINHLALALSNAQSKAMAALKDSSNPFVKSKYADLESVWSALREPLTENKLCVIQTTDFKDGITVVITTLAHSSGQWIRGYYPLNPVKNDPQAVGSALTYARRYALAAITGIVQVDDDGEAAMHRSKPDVISQPNGAPAASPLPGQTSAGPICCERPMMASKFKEKDGSDSWFCVTCRSKRPRLPDE